MKSSNINHRISVIIPAYNEEKSLPYVLQDLPRKIIKEIIVVDNASTDKTPQEARQLGCRVIYEARRGYGQACLSGIANQVLCPEWH